MDKFHDSINLPHLSKKQLDERHKLAQSGLQGIMKMPLELFMEIASHVHPGDLISLIRTTKFFRTLLLVRSSAPVWKRSLSSVRGLPPCPTGMMEPQYAALMFSEHCTICGTQEGTGMPDPYLRVRLCPTCRDTELTEWDIQHGLLRNSVPFSQHTRPSGHSRYGPLGYRLRTEKEETKRREKELNRNSDLAELVLWARQRHADWYIRSGEGDVLLEYIVLAAEPYSRVSEDLKTERRTQIYERLKTRGWNENYFNFWKRNLQTIQNWRSLVEVPEPLTEQAWADMLPTLEKLLEGNCRWVDQYEEHYGWDWNRFKMEELLRTFKEDMDLYQPIVDVLQQSLAKSEPLDDIKKGPAFRAPFPDMLTACHWGSIVCIYKQATSSEYVERRFNEVRDKISQKLSEWRTNGESQLVKQYTASFTEVARLSLNTVLTVRGSTDSTRHLSDNARFLLRADTVLMRNDSEDTEMYDKYGPTRKSYHYPDIPDLQNYPYLNDVVWGRGPEYCTPPDNNERELQPYVRHFGKETVVKTLLRELDIPDVAHIELEYMGKVFVCGRCTLGEAMEWNEIVEHYYLTSMVWVGDGFVHYALKTKHPVIFQNTHDLELCTSAEPLVCIRNDTCVPLNPITGCLICHWINHFQNCTFGSMEGMRKHMLKMYDVTESVQGLHFVTEPYLSDMLEAIDGHLGDKRDWEKKWDAYHDARSAVDEAGA
ncbi:unnamed protein product [Rhizoctonia solani]|uniref:F-box domain-containing protein n=1 Tax=Rhizoctonia solani TaxID=456999 RepID=A0A8H3CIL3_9AGAM|nr:unnamed protein product [Rhizoctonia solani]